MQTVSTDWAALVAAPKVRLSDGVFISWLRDTGSADFFTIGTSTIEGGDFIKSGGSAAAFFDKYQFDDYTSYVAAWTVERKLGSLPFGLIMAQANLELDNSSKLFTPGYDPTIGDYVLPNRPIKLSVGYDGESFQQFVGFTTRPVNTRSTQTTALHAYDVMEYVNNYKSELPVQAGVRFDELLEAGLLEMGFDPSQYELDQSLQQPIGYLAPYNKKWGDIIRWGCEAEQGIVFADENGIIRFWNRQHFLTNTSTVHSLTFSNMEDFETDTTPIINDVIVRGKPRAVGVNQRIFELQVAETIPAGGSKVVVVDFTDDFGELPVTAMDTPTVGGNTSRYRANALLDDSGTDVSANVTVTDSDLVGTTAFITFANSGTSPAYLTQLVIYGTPAKVTAPVEERYRDEASIEAYGLNPDNNGEPLVIENDLIQDWSTALSLATTMVEENKTPNRRYSPPLLGANPALQIGDFIQVTDGDTGEVKTMYLMGYRIWRRPGGELGQILNLEERTIKSYFTIGSSAIAGTDEIAP